MLPPLLFAPFSPLSAVAALVAPLGAHGFFSPLRCPIQPVDLSVRIACRRHRQRRRLLLAITAAFTADLAEDDLVEDFLAEDDLAEDSPAAAGPAVAAAAAAADAAGAEGTVIPHRATAAAAAAVAAAATAAAGVAVPPVPPLPLVPSPLAPTALPPLCPILVSTPAAVAAAGVALSRFTLLGLDTETKPSFVRGSPPQPPATLQLAGATRGGPPPDTAYVVDLLALNPAGSGRASAAAAAALSAALGPLLSSPDISILGVGIADDLLGLARWYGAAVPALGGVVRGVVDLAPLGRSAPTDGADVTGDPPLPPRPGRSLRALASQYLAVNLRKSIALSNWAARPLSATQLAYAAEDARVAVAIALAADAASPAATAAALPPPASLDLSTVSVHMCGACGRWYRTRAALRRACVGEGEGACGSTWAKVAGGVTVHTVGLQDMPPTAE